MKIGDKVRFLNEVGGGRVAGFQDSHTVLVEDQDGFQIPVLVTDVVVIDTDDYNIAKVDTMGRKEKTAKPAAATPSAPKEKPTEPYRYTTAAADRPGADLLNLQLGFVAAGPGGVGQEMFDAYFINDCNYCVTFAFLSAENGQWRVRFEGTAEPNTKLMLDTIARTELGQMERVCFQLFAYKHQRPFLLKPAMSVELRLDGTKFFKPGAFVANDFFHEPALLLDVVRDDQAARSLFLRPEAIEEAMMQKQAAASAPAPVSKPNRPRRGEPIEIDLHASEVLDSTDGLEPKDILDCQLRVFRRTMEEHKNHKGTRLVFIHGKGNGVLRAEILKALRHDYKQCLYQDASFREYGFGATLVTIK